MAAIGAIPSGRARRLSGAGRTRPRWPAGADGRRAARGDRRAWRAISASSAPKPRARKRPGPATISTSSRREPPGAGQSPRRLPALRPARSRGGSSTRRGLPDLSEVRGQEVARRALEVAAAGGHNLLMIGPPGAGKSMLAARLPSILPPLNPRELLDVSMIQSIAGELAGGALSRSPAVPRAAPFGLDGGAGRRRPAGCGRARSASRITACCSSTNCPSSRPRCSTACASRSKPARR